MTSRTFILTVLLTLGFATYAAAETIDFEEVSAGNHTALTTDGFRFSNGTTFGFLFSIGSEGDNQFLSVGADSVNMLGMTGPFDLLQFDAAAGFGTGFVDYRIGVQGRTTAGATLFSPFFNLNGSTNYQTIHIGWTNLISVRFIPFSSAIRVDNISVSVPEPTTLVLLGAGLVGLIAGRKRYQRV